MPFVRRLTAFLLPTLTFSLTPGSAQEIGPRLQAFVDAGTLAGAVVLVADRDRVLDLTAVGWADSAAGKPMTPATLFWIASESKPITASALMMLVDEGKVRLDDPVAQYLPEFQDLGLVADRTGPRVRPRRAITLRDILSHTSGLPFRSARETPTLDGLTLQDAARSYAATPLDFEPGMKYQYSNAGINTVGRIIEVVAGQPYEQFLQTHLFDPLGMVDTTFRPSTAQVGRLAASYKPTADKKGLERTTIDQLRYPLDDPTRHPVPAGGLFATAADLARFGQMILNDGTLDGRRYLTAESVREMTRRQTPPALKESYGLGWSVNGAEFGHGGAFATNLTIDRARGLILIFMVQQNGWPRDGDRALGVCRAAAIARFGTRQP